jgi:hypothetical protein
MSVGKAIAKADIDAQIASFGVQFNYLLNQVKLFTAALDAITDAALQAAPYSYTSGELATLRSAYRDLDKFRQVYSGVMYVASGTTQGTGVPTANDATHFGYNFGLFPGQVSGFGF